MKKINAILLLFIAVFSFWSCEKESPIEPVMPEKLYNGGFFIVNEGWFGHENGSVNYYDGEKSEIITNIYKTNNEPLELGVTTCYGVEWEGNYYFISKQGARIVQVDVASYKHKNSLETIGGDGRAFAGITKEFGVVTTSNGAYIVNLNPLSIGNVLEKSEGAQCGGVYTTKDHVFVISSTKGILIYSVSQNFKLVKEYAKGSVGFARSKDGSLWAANNSTLLKIDTKTLDIAEIEMPAGVKINNSWGAWNKGSLSASPIENVLFFTKTGMFGGGNNIYRYVIGDVSSLNTVFAKSTISDDSFYGAGINVDPVSGDIVATFTKDGYGDNFKDNRLVIFDGKTGTEKKRIIYDHYWFPSMIIFNN